MSLTISAPYMEVVLGPDRSVVGVGEKPYESITK